MNNTIPWTSPTGEVINFHICDYNGIWNNVGGIYMMCGFNSFRGVWEPIYIGKADDFKSRLSGHEQWLPAVHRGASKVLAFVECSAEKRDFFERMLIRVFKPALNKQLVYSRLGERLFR